MREKSFEKLARHLKPGKVYRRDSLRSYSTAVDRDLMRLLQEGVLEKVAAGLYHKPKKSRCGEFPPEEKTLVKAFLRDDQFLLFSWDEYNLLDLDLTDLHNRIVVYNYKRHGLFKLANQEYHFRRPARGFPTKQSPAFLLVDLLNNLGELTEDADKVKEKIKTQLAPSLLKQAAQRAKQYGKVATRKFFEELKP